MENQVEKAVSETVMVRRQFSTKGAEGPIEESDRTLEVHTFAVEPAKVTFEAGATINMGNYESVRLTVGVSIPCYLEELSDALVHARDFVEKELEKQVKDARSAKKKDLF
jgi:hypothetical protein